MLEKLPSLLSEIEKGNNLGEKITLVGATKTVNVDTINLAVKKGLLFVAENKVQEFIEKTDYIDKSASQHFIGHLQTNKLKYLVGKVDVIQSVDSLHLAAAISDTAKKKNVIQKIFLQVNIGNEETKSGFSLLETLENANTISKLDNIKITGLMAMLPKSDDRAYLKKLCLQMRELYDTMIEKGFKLSFLSVGMSHDYKIAIENGSNMIRLGSAIFGERNYNV